MWISVNEAAERLGVGARRVRQLIEQGDLAASRLGRSWAVDSAAVDKRLNGESPPGRPYSVWSSWRMAAMADALVRHDKDQWSLIEFKGSLSDPAQARWHAVKALRNLFAHGSPDIVAAMLRSRSDRVEYRYVHHSLARKLASDDRLVISGPKAAEEIGDLVADERLEAYIKESDLSAVESKYGLQPVDAEQSNVILRVVESDLSWKSRAAPLLFVAADLRDRGDPRAREASDHLFRRLQDALESAEI